MTLYSLNGAEPAELPFRIVMPDGFTRTDPESFTAEEIAAAGYVVAPAKPNHDPAIEHPPAWNGSGWIVTPLTAEELVAAERATIPQAVTRAQAKIALARTGYYEQAETLINAIPGSAGLEARIWWNEAETFRFDHPLVDAMCMAMTPPISAEAKADLFRAAAVIE